MIRRRLVARVDVRPATGKACVAPVEAGLEPLLDDALAEINPAWKSLQMSAGSQAKAWNEFIGRHGGAR
jgi:hypothetical protein